MNDDSAIRIGAIMLGILGELKAIRLVLIESVPQVSRDKVRLSVSEVEETTADAMREVDECLKK